MKKKINSNKKIIKEKWRPVDHFKDVKDDIIPKIKINDEGKNLLSEGINNIIHEYWIKKNLFDTVDTFQKELLKIQENIPLNYDKKLIEYFNIGEYDKFFLIWSKYIPLGLRLKDISTIEIEFFLNVYFCIYNLNKKNDFNKFKDYLKLQGDELSKIDSLLPYFALPYVKRPDLHPIFKRIYTNEWKVELEKKLVLFLNSLYNIESEPFLTYLYQFYWNNYKKKNEKLEENNDWEKSDVNYDKKEYISYINELEHNNNYLVEVVKHYNQKSKEFENKIDNLKQENENSIEIQQKWAVFSEEILTLSIKIYNFSEQHVNEDKKDNLKNFSMLLQDYKTYLELNKNDLKMKDNKNLENINLNKSEEINYKINNKDEIKNKNKISFNNSKEFLFVGIDFNKIKDDLLSKNNFSQIWKLINYLWNKTVILRRIYILLISRYNIFEFDNNENLIKNLSDENNKILFLKCINNICSDYEGRSYIIKSEKILIILIDLLKNEKKDNSIRSNSWAIIQKISLRVEKVKLMIDHGIIELIITYLLNYKELSDYSLEYSIALILNLSLRKDANEKFCENKNDILIILFKILESCNSIVRNFIHGLLFSLINIKEIKEVALELDIKTVLTQNFDEIEEIFQKQINYIIKKVEDNIEENEENNYMQECDSDNFNINDNDNNSMFNNSVYSNWNDYNIDNEYLLENEEEKNQLNEIKPLIEKKDFKKNLMVNENINEIPINRPTTPSMLINSQISDNKKLKQNLRNDKNPFNINEELNDFNLEENNYKEIEDNYEIKEDDDEGENDNGGGNGDGNDEWKQGFLPRPKIPRTPLVDLKDNINKI